MSGSRWVITPSWLSGPWRPFLYSSSVYSCQAGRGITPISASRKCPGCPVVKTPHFHCRVEGSSFGVEVKSPHAAGCGAPQIASACIVTWPSSSCVCLSLCHIGLGVGATAVWLHYDLTSPVNRLFSGSSPWGGCPFTSTSQKEKRRAERACPSYPLWIYHSSDVIPIFLLFSPKE